MDCLKNFISIQGCNAPAYSWDANEDEDDNASTNPTPASGLFINVDLPISLKQIDAIADEEQTTFIGVWDEVQNRAIKKFVIRVKAGYKALFNVCQGLDEDWFCTNRQELAISLLYFLGSELMFERLYSDRINRYTTVDRAKAKDLRDEFDAQFITELKSALEIINDCSDAESGEIFSYEEVLP